MEGECDESYEVTNWRHDGDATLAEFHVDARIGKCSDGVSCERSEEDERNDGITEIVICFKL